MVASEMEFVVCGHANLAVDTLVVHLKHLGLVYRVCTVSRPVNII